METRTYLKTMEQSTAGVYTIRQSNYPNYDQNAGNRLTMPETERKRGLVGKQWNNQKQVHNQLASPTTLITVRMSLENNS